MSRVCDCSDSEKAYLIINPESVDRQEILSLNPPICRDVIPKALSINGEILVFNQEIDANNPFSLLPTEGTIPAGNWYRIRGFVKRSNGTTAGVTSSVIFFNPVGQPFIEGNRIRGTAQTTTTNEASFCPTISSTQITRTGINASFGVDATKSPFWVLDRVCDAVNWLDEGCPLVLNYADGNTFDYGQIPCDASISLIDVLEISDNSGILTTIAPFNNQSFVFQCGERECPPETCCNPCEGSALNCCYDENGKLIDSFVRRT